MGIAIKKSKSKNAAITGGQSADRFYLMPKMQLRSRIRSIGNSKGVILNNQLIEAAGLNSEVDIMIHAADGIICIIQFKTSNVNTDLSTWDRQFRTAIKKGAKPEKDLFGNISNDFDLKEW
jgi:antitoxin component of MazEF toxin-antitoxin module